jgi:hypothetical protein
MWLKGGKRRAIDQHQVPGGPLRGCELRKTIYNSTFTKRAEGISLLNQTPGKA